MPYDQKVTDVAVPLQQIIDRFSYADEVVILVDMGSLQDIYKSLESTSGMTLGIINNASTGLAVEVAPDLSRVAPCERFSTMLRQLAPVIITSWRATPDRTRLSSAPKADLTQLRGSAISWRRACLASPPRGLSPLTGGSSPITDLRMPPSPSTTCARSSARTIRTPTESRSFRSRNSSPAKNGPDRPRLRTLARR